jgi:hypothetical protein
MTRSKALPGEVSLGGWNVRIYVLQCLLTLEYILSSNFCFKAAEVVSH